MTSEKSDILVFSYEKVAEHSFDKHEFGVPYWGHFTWHKMPDSVIVAAYRGHRFAELWPDGSQYLIFNKETHSAGTTNRWARFFKNTSISTKRITRANGQKRTAISIYRYEYTPTKAKVLQDDTFVGDCRFKIEEDNGNIKLIPIPEKTTTKYEKDNVKYRAFNKQLREFKAVLVAQAKMGAYDDLLKLTRYTRTTLASEPSLQKLVCAALGVKNSRHFSHSDLVIAEYKLAREWLETRDNSVLRSFMPVCLMAHSSRNNYSSGDRDSIPRRINSAIAAVQKCYLRRHCVKISESDNSLSLTDESDDQDRELLPSAGLRKVQVSGEAQVC